MKTPRNRRAFALLLVLIAIVLSTSMAVFFLTSAGRERRGVSLYATSSEVRHLASSAVSRVMGQINAATKEGTATAPVSWASQPGMVRTFAGGGDAQNIYKLYSWDSALSVPGSGFDPTATAEVPPAGWNARKAEFVDLNQPINGVYPIVDPGAIGLVEGFSINTSNPAVAGSGSAAPMPVRWLYVLEDGQMVAASGGSGSTASVTGASASNPIIGRVAFWTDDETSKVNINTASEGAYWDWPKAATSDEMQFAGNPPVGGEFNRTPGHPAMTSLSAVFPELNPGNRWSNPQYWDQSKKILQITPRIAYDESSSRGGTFPIVSKTYDFGPKTGASFTLIPGSTLPLKTDRLFVSPDELLFTPDRSLAQDLTVDMIKKRNFFLTSTSRAPETTLFETPRISLWPVTWPYASSHASLPNRQIAAVSSPNPDTTLLENNTWMRAEERLLAFTSTLNRQRSGGGDKYYFQRQNPESPTHDYNQILRNRQLLTYLQDQTEKSVPGYGETFVTKYPAVTRDFILANTFNGIRSLVNQYTLDADPSPTTAGKMLYSYTPIAFARFRDKNNNLEASRNESGAFSPIPLKINLGSGEITTLSEFPLLREVALSFYATDRRAPSPLPVPPLATAQEKNRFLSNPYNWQNLINLNPSDVYPDGAQTTQMRALLLLDFSSVRGSSRNNRPVFWVKIGGSPLRVNGTDLKLNNAVAKMDFRQGNLPAHMLSMYTRNAKGDIAKATENPKDFVNGNISDANYGLISVPIGPIAPTDTDFTFSGGEITVQVYGIQNGNPNTDPTGDASLLIATYRVDFSSWNGPHSMPLAPYWNFNELKVKAVGATINPEPVFPNPNFKDGYKPTLPDLPETRDTKWAAIEIAALYRSGTNKEDPAKPYASVGTESSVWHFSALYGNTDPTDGTLNAHLLPVLLGSSFQGSYPVTYIYQDSNGKLMTDIKRRLTLGTPLSAASIALGTGRNLVSNRDDVFGNGFPLITPFDTVISVRADSSAAGSGDPRLAIFNSFIRVDDPKAIGSTAPLLQVIRNSEYPSQRPKQLHTLGDTRNSGYVTRGAFSLLGSNLASNGMALWGGVSKIGTLGNPGGTDNNIDEITVASSKPRDSFVNGSVGDWTSGPGIANDGGILVRPDQDFQTISPDGPAVDFSHQVPYFQLQSQLGGVMAGLNAASTRGMFSSSRQIPSPITLLGGQPSSVTVGWQTLAFSPNPAVGTNHPGLIGLPDHVLLDLFWMPVAEPYPISEDFSTAGKINLNYRIMPFDYIKRRTGLEAVMKSTWTTSLNNTLAEIYKSHFKTQSASNTKTRYTINTTETLDRFDTDVFDTGDIFRSASQICEMWLVPEGRTAANVEAFWNDKLLTSDTAREAPYDHLYSRVTTKSNTFTVHWRAQILKKVPGTTATVWDESKDRVMSELRGSTLIERFIDPNATDIPDYATVADAEPLSNFYKWRVVSENYFQP